jgi:hypothetical protein
LVGSSSSMRCGLGQISIFSRLYGGCVAVLKMSSSHLRPSEHRKAHARLLAAGPARAIQTPRYVIRRPETYCFRTANSNSHGEQMINK